MKRRALCLIRHALVYRRDVFVTGLKRAGFTVQDEIGDPGPDDVLVTWNRYGYIDETARRFERVGARVIVCENGYLGKQWLGDTWIAMAKGHHAGAGKWFEGGSERWDSLHVQMEPFKQDGKDLVIFAQRGIGEDGIACPDHWADQVQRRYGGRIRRHPANANVCALEEDLKDAFSTATWNSAAGLRSLFLGVPVWYAFSKWIGAEAASPLALYGKEAPCRDEVARLRMFRKLAWAQWRLDEILSGEAFAWLLQPMGAEVVVA